jgi:hypothetical protein
MYRWRVNWQSTTRQRPYRGDEAEDQVAARQAYRWPSDSAPYQVAAIRSTQRALCAAATGTSCPGRCVTACGSPGGPARLHPAANASRRSQRRLAIAASGSAGQSGRDPDREVADPGPNRIGIDLRIKQQAVAERDSSHVDTSAHLLGVMTCGVGEFQCRAELGDVRASRRPGRNLVPANTGRRVCPTS